VHRAEEGGAPFETSHAAGILSGRAAGWLKPGEPLDFFEAKRVVEVLLRGFGLEAVYQAPASVPFMHPGASAEIRLPQGGQTPAQTMGLVGELHPRVARRLGIEARAFYFQIAVDLLEGARGAIRASAPPRFPAVTRDVSFWIEAPVTADEQRVIFQSAGEGLLRSLAVLEDFRDPRYAPPGKKGMLWTMTYRSDERTLTDQEVDAAHARAVKALADRHPIQIR
jgi:phenylalanyl-tRNA synthetase beta chain